MSTLRPAFRTNIKRRKVRPNGTQPAVPQPALSPEVLLANAKRRVRKAERDERMDLTLALTPAKTQAPGFTRPGDLRSANWWRGGRYLEKGKSYESPPAAAYKNHTVFLIESRYPIQYGVGRSESLDHLVGVCKEGDLPTVLRRYNSDKAPGSMLKNMDNAHWPWLRMSSVKSTKWWNDSEDPEQIHRNIREDGTFHGNGDAVQPEHLAIETGDDHRKPTLTMHPRHSKGTALASSYSNSSAFSPLDTGSLSPNTHVRLYSTSNRKDRVGVDDLEEGNTNRPKKEKDGVAARIKEESLLVEATEEIISMRRPSNKIPFEYESHGVIRHPSGFVVPSPGEAPDVIAERRPRKSGMQTAAVKESVEESSSFLPDVKAGTSRQQGKIPVEIPTDDGNVVHPSGFVPPTSASSFKKGGPKGSRSYATQLYHPAFPPIPSPPPPPSETLKVKPVEEPEISTPLRDHIFSTSELKEAFKKAPQDNDRAILDLRAQYLPTLAETPFWRPLLAVTFSTRPLAMSVSRLSKARERGTPFHAVVDNDDKKFSTSLSSRMRNMYLDRLLTVAARASKLLSGERGGFVGIRFGTEELGRGVDGEGLADPIRYDKRVVKIGVGESHKRVDELMETCKEEIDMCEVFGMDDWGRRLDKDGRVVETSANDEMGEIEFMEDDVEFEADDTRVAIR